MHIINVWKIFSNFASSVKAGKPTADHNRSSYTYCVIDYSDPGGIWGRTFLYPDISFSRVIDNDSFWFNQPSGLI